MIFNLFLQLYFIVVFFSSYRKTHTYWLLQINILCEVNSCSTEVGITLVTKLVHFPKWKMLFFLTRWLGILIFFFSFFNSCYVCVKLYSGRDKTCKTISKVFLFLGWNNLFSMVSSGSLLKHVLLPQLLLKEVTTNYFWSPWVRFFRSMQLPIDAEMVNIEWYQCSSLHDWALEYQRVGKRPILCFRTFW